MKKERKYIIMYGYSYSEEFYSFAFNITEAKQHIKDCMSENGIGIDDIICLEIKSKNISSKITINIK